MSCYVKNDKNYIYPELAKFSDELMKLLNKH